MTKKTLKGTWRKVTHNMPWWSALVIFVFGIIAGFLWGNYNSGQYKYVMYLLNDWIDEIVMLALIVILLGRMISVARWPRDPPLDYNKISMPGVVAANFITIIMGIMLLIITLALVAPGALELLAKYGGGK